METKLCKGRVLQRESHIFLGQGRGPLLPIRSHMLQLPWRLGLELDDGAWLRGWLQGAPRPQVCEM